MQTSVSLRLYLTDGTSLIMSVPQFRDQIMRNCNSRKEYRTAAWPENARRPLSFVSCRDIKGAGNVGKIKCRFTSYFYFSHRCSSAHIYYIRADCCINTIPRSARLGSNLRAQKRVIFLPWQWHFHISTNTCCWEGTLGFFHVVSKALASWQGKEGAYGLMHAYADLLECPAERRTIAHWRVDHIVPACGIYSNRAQDYLHF